MEHLVTSAPHAAEAAITAYRAARRAKASKIVADDVALARFRAFFPLATASECRHRMHEHLAHTRLLRQRAIIRAAYALDLAVSN
jgi:hypothetical protein